MALDARTTELRIRAVLEQGLAPLDQVVAKLQAATTAIKQQAQGTDLASKSEKGYADALKSVQAELTNLVKLRGQADELARREKGSADAAAKLSTRADQLETARTKGGANPTAPQQRAIDTAQTNFDNQEKRVAATNAKLQQQYELLQRIGLLSQDVTRATAGEQIAQVQDRLNTILNNGLDLLEQMRNGQGDFVAKLAASIKLNETLEAIDQRRVTLQKEQAENIRRIATNLAAVGKAQAEGEAAAARAVSQTEALAHRPPRPAPTLADNVSGVLRPPPGPGTGTLTDLQAEVERINRVFATGGSDAKTYTAALKDLDRTYGDLDRAARTITGFVERQRAVEASGRAYDEAVTKVEHLRAALKLTDDPQAAQHIRDEITALGRAIGETGGSGLAAKFARDKDAIEEVRGALHALGVDVTTLENAYGQLTNTAIHATEARAAAEKRAQAEIVAAIERTKEQRKALAENITTPRQVTTPSLVETVSTILPARGTPRDIEDVSGAIDTLSASMGKNKLTAEGLNRAMSEVWQLQKQVASDAGLIDTFKRQEQAAKAAGMRFLEASRELSELEARSKTAGGGNVTHEQITRAQTNLNVSAAEVRSTQQALTDLNAKLQQRKINTEQIDQAAQHLIATMTRLQSVERGLEASGNRVFGLNPYQVQNLGFQINDVVTQLSLGQGILMTLFSQGGQILQIFDLTIGQLKSLAVYAAAAFAIVGPLIAAFERFQETEQAQRRFSALLDGSALSANTSAAALIKLAREVENTGVKFGDANKAITQFVLTGLNTAQIERYTKAVANLSIGLGKPIEDVAKDFNDIPTAGAARLLEILQKYGELTPELTRQILAFQDLGKSADAQNLVLDALERHGITARQNGVSPLTEEVIKLTKSWHEFLDAIGNDDAFKFLLERLDDFLVGLRVIVNTITGIKKTIDDLTGASIRAAAPIGSGVNERRVASAQAALDKAKADKKEIDAVAPGSTWAKDAGEKVDALAIKLQKVIELKEQFERSMGRSTATPNAPPAPTGGGTTIPGVGGSVSFADPATNEIAQGLVRRGMALSDAIAFTANAIRESGADFTKVGDPKVQGGTFGGTTVPGGSHGLFQWNRERLADFVRQNDGKLPEQTSVQAQLDFVMSEITGKFKDAYAELQRTTDQGDKARVVTSRFEIPADPVGQGNISARTAQRLASGVAGAGISPSSPIGASFNEQTRKQLEDDLRDLKAKTSATIARGFSEQAAEEDRLYKEQVDRESKIKYAATNKNIDLDKANETRRQAIVDELVRQRQTQRERENDEDRRGLQNSIAQAETKVDNLKKARGDVDAAERAFRNSEVPALNAARDALKKLGPGAKTADGQDAQSVVDSLSKGIEEGVKQARVDAAKLGFDAAVETLNNQAAGAQEAFKNGSISLTTMFERIADAVKQSAPKIKDAQTVALAELANAPVNPKNIAIGTAVQGVDLTGRKITEAADDTAATDIQRRIAARDSEIKSIKDKLDRSLIGNREADDQTQAAFKKSAPAINEEIDALQKRLDLQKELSQVTPAYYEKQSAALKKLAGETSDLTQLEKDLNRGFEQSVTSRTLSGLEAISEAIAGVVQGTLTWKQGIAAIGAAFAQTALGIIKDISSIIIKEELLNAIHAAGGLSGILKSVLGLVGAAAGGAAGVPTGGFDQAAAADATIAFASNYQVPVIHTGGTIGDVPLMRRTVSLPSSFTAGVYHSGGVVGLKHREQLALVEEGEVILNKQQQAQEVRNRKAMKEAAGSVTVTPVVAFNEDQIAEAILNAPSGNKVFVAQAKRNSGYLRQIVR